MSTYQGTHRAPRPCLICRLHLCRILTPRTLPWILRGAVVIGVAFDAWLLSHLI